MTRQTHTVPVKDGAMAFLRPHRGTVANLVALLMEDQPAPQLPLEFFAPPPEPAGHAWRAFTLDTPEEEAAAVFARRYGRNPEFVFESRGLLLCGPVPEVLL